MQFQAFSRKESSMTCQLLCTALHHRKVACLQIFIEYVMLANVNDSPKEAHELGQLLSHRRTQYMVNLIPWNPVFSPEIQFEAPGAEILAAFHSIVRSYDLLCTVRREMGQEIAGDFLAISGICLALHQCSLKITPHDPELSGKRRVACRVWMCDCVFVEVCRLLAPQWAAGRRVYGLS